VRAPKEQIGWQSWVVLAAVAPWCAFVALRHATTIALGVSLALALLVLVARAATPAAAVTGGVITAVLTLAWSPWYHSALLSLVALFVLTLAATRFGRAKKQQLGIAEDKRGRNAAQVAANLGMAGLAAAFAITHPQAGGWYAVLVTAALGEATADTLSSEFGEVLGGQPVLVTTFCRVSPGTDGAISLAGTVAGISGALLVIAVAWPTLKLSPGDAGCALIGAVGGLFLDSLLGATVERRGWLNNDAVNFLSTVAAAGVANLCYMSPYLHRSF
jgi:uncharacterized protein (TIGR00297 family)